MYRLALILGVVGALGLPAHAATWRKSCQSGQVSRSVTVGGFVCSHPTSATDDTDVLDTQECENIDILVYEDANGDGTAATTSTHQIQHCPLNDAVDTDAEEDAACVDLGAPHTGTGATLGAAAVRVKIQEGGVFVANSDPQVVIRCNGPTR